MAAAVADQATTYSRTDAKLYALIVNLSTQYNTKLIEQLKSVWNKK